MRIDQNGSVQIHTIYITSKYLFSLYLLLNYTYARTKCPDEIYPKLFDHFRNTSLDS